MQIAVKGVQVWDRLVEEKGGGPYRGAMTRGGEGVGSGRTTTPLFRPQVTSLIRARVTQPPPHATFNGLVLAARPTNCSLSILSQRETKISDPQLKNSIEIGPIKTT